MKESEHILIIDDEKEVLQTTAELLRRTGYTCTCVQDAHAALPLLEDESYDLLISDIKMLDNLPPELAQRRTQPARGVPVILMTAHPVLEAAIQAIQFPVSPYLV